MLNLFNQSDLFLFNLNVFCLELIKLSNKSVDFLSILAYLIEAVMLQSVLFNLCLLILFCKISKLISEGSVVSLPMFEFINFCLELTYEEFLMLRDSWSWWTINSNISASCLGFNLIVTCSAISC
jgi:hypothetical protein